MFKYIIAFLLAIPSLAQAQWVQVAKYGQVPIAVNSGTYLQYGPVGGPYWVKYYSAGKTISSWSAEFTTNPVQGGNVNTYVLSAVQLPLASNTVAQIITVAGSKITIPPFTGVPAPPLQSGKVTITLNCVITPTNIGCQ